MATYPFFPIATYSIPTSSRTFFNPPTSWRDSAVPQKRKLLLFCLVFLLLCFIVLIAYRINCPGQLISLSQVKARVS